MYNMNSNVVTVVEINMLKTKWGLGWGFKEGGSNIKLTIFIERICFEYWPDVILM